LNNFSTQQPHSFSRTIENIQFDLKEYMYILVKMLLSLSSNNIILIRDISL